MKILMYMILVLLSFNCVRKEESSTTDNYLINDTGHFIKVDYYSNGVVQISESVTLVPDEVKNGYTHFSRGKGNDLSYGEKVSFFDSALILFDDTIKSVHYSFKADTTGKKGIKFQSSRNIFNPSNYSGGKVSETRYSGTYEYRFQFTKQDYVNAKL